MVGEVELRSSFLSWGFGGRRRDEGGREERGRARTRRRAVERMAGVAGARGRGVDEREEGKLGEGTEGLGEGRGRL